MISYHTSTHIKSFQIPLIYARGQNGVTIRLPMEDLAVICLRVQLSGKIWISKQLTDAVPRCSIIPISARVPLLDPTSCPLLMRRLEVSLWSPAGCARFEMEVMQFLLTKYSLQAMIDISGKKDQHVVKCNSCNEATPIRNAPPGRK